MSWAEARARFPVLERFAYLNAGTFGPLSRAALDAERALREWEGQNGRAGETYFDAMLERRDRVRALLAEQIRVPADHVSLADSTTGGVQTVVVGGGGGAAAEVVTKAAVPVGQTGPRRIGPPPSLRLFHCRSS